MKGKLSKTHQQCSKEAQPRSEASQDFPSALTPISFIYSSPRLCPPLRTCKTTKATFHLRPYHSDYLRTSSSRGNWRSKSSVRALLTKKMLNWECRFFPQNAQLTLILRHAHIQTRCNYFVSVAESRCSPSHLQWNLHRKTSAFGSNGQNLSRHLLFRRSNGLRKKVPMKLRLVLQVKSEQKASFVRKLNHERPRQVTRAHRKKLKHKAEGRGTVTGG